MKNYSTLIVFAILTFQLFGQSKTEIIDDRPYIELTGTAEKEVVPNQIYIEIILKERFEGKEKLTIELQEEKLKNLLNSLGIELSNLYVSNADADFVRIRWKKKDVLIRKAYTLKVSSAEQLGKVYEELDKIDINEASIVKLNHSQMDSIRKEVRIMAIKAAKSKADYMLTAIGEQTGKPIIVREISINEQHPYSNAVLNDGYELKTEYLLSSTSSKKEENEIQFRKIKIQTSVFVRFMIK